MDLVNRIYNYRPLALFLITVENLIEHFQILGLLKFAYHDEEAKWTPQAADFIDWLFEHFLFKTKENHHKSFYAACIIVVGCTVIVYGVFMNQIHKYNAGKMTVALAVILLIDHVVYGPGAYAMAKILASNKLCTEYEVMLYDSSVDCWGTTHLSLMWFGYIFLGLILTLACGIGPILRAERVGVEKQFGNDGFCPSLYKLYLFGCLFLLMVIKEPYLGVIAGVPTICYLLYFEGYEEPHIVKIKIASVTGIVWGLICCEELKNDRTNGSDMLLIGWGFSLAIGYSLLTVKHILFPRKNPFEMTIDKLPN